MRFALVFNPFKYKVHEENLKIVQKYFGLFPPLSLAWVAAVAEQAGHEVIIVDARTLDLSKEETLEVLKAFNPDIMGFMMTTYMFPDTLEWIKFLKQCLGVPVVIGGYNLRVYPKESVSHPEIEFGVVEHAYYTIPALFRELESRDPNFDNVPGLVYKKDKNIIEHNGLPEIKSLFLEAFERGCEIRLLSREIFLHRGSEIEWIRDFAIKQGYPTFLKIYDYHLESPDGSIISSTHSKMAIADNLMAYIGSGEFRKNSLIKNFEIGCLVQGPIVAGLCESFDLMTRYSKEWYNDH